MSSPPPSNATVQLGLLERVIYSSLTTLPCFIFLFINGTMMFTLRSKAVFCETCRYVLLYNLLLVDMVHLSVSQLQYLLSMFRVFLTYPQCGVFFILAILANEVSPLMLVLMSAERCVAVCLPLRHSSIVTVRNTSASVVLVWVLCLLNELVRVLLLLEFPFRELETLQMKTFCSTLAMTLTLQMSDFDRASTSVLFLLAGVMIISSYVAVILAARSASTDRTSAVKARNTVLLHLVQLCFSLLSAVHNPLLYAVSKLIPPSLLLRVQNVFYLFIIIVPRCLASLIYGLRDQTIRPVLLYYLSCRVKLPGITVRAKVSP